MENINVCIRIRPTIIDETNSNNSLSSNSLFKVEGNSILNMKSKDILTYGN